MPFLRGHPRGRLPDRQGRARAAAVAVLRRHRRVGVSLARTGASLAMGKPPLRDGKIFLGHSIEPEYLELRFANRHGLITGATGTGKTVSLQVLAEGFADAGVPVFAADIKGDLSGVAETGTFKDALGKRVREVGLTDWASAQYPTAL